MFISKILYNKMLRIKLGKQSLKLGVYGNILGS